MLSTCYWLVEYHGSQNTQKFPHANCVRSHIALIKIPKACQRNAQKSKSQQCQNIH
jgi:hypothetical protein